MFLYSQDSTKNCKKIHELYLTASISNITSFSISSINYKTSINEKYLWRFSIGRLSGDRREFLPATSNLYSNTEAYISGKFSFGLERRYAVTDNIQFFTGIDATGFCSLKR